MTDLWGGTIVGSFPWTKGVEMIDGELPIFRETPDAVRPCVNVKKIGVVKPSFSHTAMLEIHIYDGEVIPSAVRYMGDRYEAVYE